MRYDIGRMHRPFGIGKSVHMVAMNSFGAPAPLLDLNFLSGSLDQRITFSRTTAATRINASGYVESMAIDVPRFTYDPSTLEPLGLIVEGAATNLACGSETFATSGGVNNWADTNITRDSTNNADPANGTTALRVTASAGNATVLNNLSLTSAARTFSLWLRRVGGTGSIEWTMDGGTTWTAQAITASWDRYSFTATTTAHVGIRIVTSGDSIELWGAQVEDGQTMTSYIPTVASTVARGRDSAQMLGASFSSWYNQNEGTFLANWKHASPERNEFAIAVRASVSTGLPNSMWIGKQSSASAGRQIQYEIRGSGTQRLISGVTVTDSFLRAAGAYRVGGTVGFSYNGISIASAAYTQAPVPDRLHIGSFDQTSATGPINSAISRIAYWPTRLPDATLQALTT
jgi:hypothetical protein